MGNFIDWFSRSYRGIIVVLVAIMAAALVVLAMEHVNESRATADETLAPIPTYTSIPHGGPVAAFLGDSYTVGLGASSPDKRWSTLVAAQEGWSERNFGVNSTGYVNPGIVSGTDAHYLNRLRPIVALNPDIVVVSGGQNDVDGPIDATVAAMQQTLQQIHDQLPKSRLIVLGPINPGTVKANTKTLDTAVQAEVMKLHATYVSLINPDIYQAPSDLYSDGNHPSDSGHQNIAKRVEQAID